MDTEEFEGGVGLGSWDGVFHDRGVCITLRIGKSAGTRRGLSRRERILA